MKKLFLFACLLAVLAGCSKSNEPGSDPTPTPTSTGEKCKASDYPQVTIGTQIWMAENYRCSKYDTESEAYKEGRYTVSTASSSVYNPNYTDATDKTKWSSLGGDHSGKLSADQISKLGYLYNWSAAVGVPDGQQQTTSFIGNRQGICPNGWHVPTESEWQILVNFIDSKGSQWNNVVGKHLKTTSGWCDVAEGMAEYKPGLDTYGFAALPAGTASGGVAFGVGGYNELWTATPVEGNSKVAYAKYLSAYQDFLLDDGNYDNKECGYSIRCLKN